MNNKNIVKLWCIVLVLTALLLTGCDNSNNNDPKTFTVTFNANGGTPQPEAQKVTEGGKASELQGLSKDGYTLDGWYKETAFANKWNFAEDTVTADITLNAKWEIDDPQYEIKYVVELDNTKNPTGVQIPICRGDGVSVEQANTAADNIIGGYGTLGIGRLGMLAGKIKEFRIVTGADGYEAVDLQYIISINMNESADDIFSFLYGIAPSL